MIQSKGKHKPRAFAKRQQYKTIVVGGTFDILHAGHEKLLDEAFKLGEQVLIGVSSDELATKLGKDHIVRPFKDRVRDLRRFLRSQGYLERARIAELRDPFGPAALKRTVDALVVSKETLLGGRRLNRLRRAKGLRPLRIHVVGPAMAWDGKPISGTRIRRGEIDSRGRAIPRDA